MAKKHYTSSKGFFDAASGHFEAARILYPHITISEAKTGALFLAFYNVLGFSVELYLKAFLSMHGYSIDDLSSKPFCHDLQNLLGRSIELGFSVQEDGLRDIVRYLNVHHADYSYRYKYDIGDYNHLKPMELVFIVLQDIDRSLSAALV